MKRFVVLMAVVAAAMMAFGVGGASAFEGGGRSPSEAPLVTYGQHYSGKLDNRKEDSNYVGRATVAFFKIPPLATHDQLVINWHELPYAHRSEFPVCMAFVEGVNDSNWGEILESSAGRDGYCEEDAPIHDVSASGTAQTSITVQNADANSYVEFFAPASETESTKFETYEYDFSVEAPRHYLSVALGAVQKVAANGALHATATLASGAPAPDGLGFTLTGTWRNGGVFTATAASVGGQLTFPLALPETAYKQYVEFIVTSAATAEWQAASSLKLTAEVTKPPVPVPAVEPQICTKATNRAHVLARQYHRQLRHADEARGRSRRLRLREARATGRRLDAAKAARKAAC
jgi:hypothetical protein